MKALQEGEICWSSEPLARTEQNLFLIQNHVEYLLFHISVESLPPPNERVKGKGGGSRI